MMSSSSVGGIWQWAKVVVIPFLLFCQAIGWVVHVHHIAPDIRWWPRREWNRFRGQVEGTTILWGPPGVGKTTLARLMAQAFDAEFIAISAVLSGVKEIREAVARAEVVLQQSGHRTILFVDEVHRFNKSQQDAFLPYV